MKAAMVGESEVKLPTILLAGNPNAGKTSVFNRLTGLRQRIGNYPGVTVERKSGTTVFEGLPVEIIDLPGTYSLAAASPDEHVAVEALTGKIPDQAVPDVVLCVVDASNLRRHLFLVSQICDFGVPVVLALNMMDVAARKGIHIDVVELSERLGIPVIPLTATTGEGWTALLLTLPSVLKSDTPPPAFQWPAAVTQALECVRRNVLETCGKTLSHGETTRLLFDQSPWGANAIGWNLAERTQTLATASAILQKGGFNPSSCEAVIRYAYLRELLKGIVRQGKPTAPNWSYRIDAVLTHKAGGLVVFAGLMYLVFYSIYSLATPVMDAIDATFAGLAGWVTPMLSATPMLESLVVNGVIAGVGGVLTFLPQILILFAFISILEDSGYMARAAFLMDRIFGWCGLNGKSFVPMLSSFACAIPGVMATRVIADPKARLLTILISPLMSCSARLPVYVLLIGTFIEPHYGVGWAALTLFFIQILGLIVAIPVAWGLNRYVLKMAHQPFVLEMPSYRWPVPRNIAFRLWEAGREFTLRAGSIILAFSVIIWALLYFPHPTAIGEQAERDFLQQQANVQSISKTETPTVDKTDENVASALEHYVAGVYLEQSLMARFGKTMQPVFAPAGFDWKITVGVLASFPAREMIISTLGIIYRLGGEVDETSEGLRGALVAETWSSGPLIGQPVFTPAVALAIMVFFALCMQCGATLAIMAKESSWRWAVFAFCYMTTLAWLGAVATYQIASYFSI